MPSSKVKNLILEKYSQMSKTQKVIANYIEANYYKIPSMSVQELSDSIDTSYASIVRFSQMLGYDGFLDMKADIKKESSDYYSIHSRFDRALEKHTIGNKSNKTLPEMILDSDISNVNKLYQELDKDKINRLVDKIFDAATIHIIGVGLDSIIATFIEWYLCYMGFNTMCHTDSGFNTVRRISAITPNDLVILISTPRQLKIEKDILTMANATGAHTACITLSNSLEISSLCEISVDVSSKASDFINSYVCYMAVANVLIMSVYERDKENINRYIKRREQNEKYFDLLI